jgi:hypothetical protein
MRPSSLLVVLAGCFAFGCEEGFAPPSEIHGLRVLAVRPTPASGAPGVTVGLDMLLADSRSWPRDDDGVPAPPAVDVMWLAGCHNPPSRQYFACAPVLAELARHPVEAAGAGLTGRGSHYDLVIPEDILTGAPKLPQDPIHFGVSYVFFAACAGTLEAATGPTENGFPFECRDAQERAVGPTGFVVGFSTIYSYEGADAQNENPVLTSLRFGADSAPAFGPDAFLGEGAGVAAKPCITADDCEDETLEFERPRTCSDHGVCAPVVQGCAGDQCPAFRVLPEVALTGETFTGGNEIVWASYYSTLGSFGSETRLVVDRVNGPARDISSGWKPPPSSAGGPRTSRLWVTVNDQRGGATWAFFDVVVE